jgi:rubrerythrin
MATTQDNLKEAFAGESQASQKYLAFAKKAERDGFPNVAKLFRTASAAEQIHAEGHFKAMDGVSSTVDNLQAAIDGESYESATMYPPMIDQAEADGHKAKRMFKYAAEAEAIHAKIYKMALEAVLNGEDFTEEFFLCPVCGYIELGAPPESCPVCGSKGKVFLQV